MTVGIMLNSDTASSVPPRSRSAISCAQTDPLEFGKRKDGSSVRVAVLITCFNRREKTLLALRALASSEGLEGVTLHGVLVDDASTDGTAEAVTSEFPWIRVIRANGGLFWCRGMHQVFAIALQKGCDYYLWLNDDTLLFPNALSRLLKCEAALRETESTPVIVVGSTVDAMTSAQTYGGERVASPWKRLSFVRVTPTERPQSCDSMNGNLVLIPAAAARIVGNLDPAFEHAMGDIDYAQRAKKAGCTLWVAPGIHGTCSHNTIAGTYLDDTLPFRRRWQLILGRKGLPWRSWARLTRRHAGPLWPLVFCLPYLRFLFSGLRQSMFGRRRAVRMESQ